MYNAVVATSQLPSLSLATLRRAGARLQPASPPGEGGRAQSRSAWDERPTAARVIALEPARLAGRPLESLAPLRLAAPVLSAYRPAPRGAELFPTPAQPGRIIDLYV
jgi:hypothetical protein